jgi:hypothetical protein
MDTRLAVGSLSREFTAAAIFAACLSRQVDRSEFAPDAFKTFTK